MLDAIKTSLRERMASLVLLLVGAVLVYQGSTLTMGTLASFGPGLFPAIVGAAMMLVALALVTFPDMPKQEEDEEPFAWRQMLFVSLGMIAFALLVRPFGLVPATVALVCLASCGDRSSSPLVAVALSVGLAVLGVLIFIWGLNLPLSIVRW
ncbi:tripartite tricarboxylate transporter TctB family protein [Corticibacterium sp. UT-5YL-CI-8]|nr:tripartite tricarboxylate transporter TctB family protein [Tianweitania sp. UT-5YL-CI-8]